MDDHRFLRHRRTEFRFHEHGKHIRCVVFSWGIACSCRPGVDTYDCEHVRLVERLLLEPCRVACEHVLTSPLHHDVTTQAGRAAAWAEAHKAASEAIQHDDDRIRHGLWANGERTDTRTAEEREEHAARVLDDRRFVKPPDDPLTRAVAHAKTMKEGTA